MKDIIQNHKRWVFLVMYLVWLPTLYSLYQEQIYPHLPTIFGCFGRALYDLVFCTLALLTFACIFQATRCPPMLKSKVETAFKRAGLKNKCGEYPTLIAVTADPRKEHGYRYTIRNVGVSIPDIEAKIDRLQRKLGAIYEMEYSRNTECTYLYVIPGKYSKPKIVPPANDEEF